MSQFAEVVELIGERVAELRNIVHIKSEGTFVDGLDDNTEGLANIANLICSVEEAMDRLWDINGAYGLLREPFPAAMIGKLPKITCGKCRESNSKSCDTHRKSECRVCHNYITSAHLHLDYVGHAAVTDRLNQVDPGWTWRPIRWTDEGFPAFDRFGGMWIELTVLGITRPAYGDAEGMRPSADTIKGAISDAIKNGAMRFGVGIDLWSKEDLLAVNPEPVEEPKRGRTAEPVIETVAVNWLTVVKACNDKAELHQLGIDCNAAGQFKGAIKTAFLKRKTELERPLKAVTDEPATAAS